MIIGFIINIRDSNEEDVLSNQSHLSLDTGQSIEEIPENREEIQTEGLFNLIGKTSDELIAVLGQPERVDLSAYGYKWWIYNSDVDNYVQVGVEADKIVTIFAVGKNVNIKPLYIGEPVSEIYASFFIETIVNLDYNNTSFQFELSEDDINSRPLIQFGNVYAQLYIDKFSGILSSIRIMDVPTLIKLHPFELANKELPAVQAKGVHDLEKVARHNEKQLYDLINIKRVREDVKPLVWNEKAAKVAHEHSKSMTESEEGALTEPFDDLMDRLEEGELKVQAAEEVAAGDFLDSPAVVEAWVNSKAHRERLLNEDFTHTGAGVYKNFYTQYLLQLPH